MVTDRFIEKVESETKFECGYCPHIPGLGNDTIEFHGVTEEEKWQQIVASHARFEDHSTSLSEVRSFVFNNPLAYTDELIIVPTIGCFMEGYLLAITRKHVYSTGELRSRELAKVEADLSELVKNLEGIFETDSYIVFEHGSAGPSRPGGSCVRHAHYHLMPIGMQNIRRVLMQRAPKQKVAMKWIELSSYSKLSEFKGENYAFVDSGLEKWIWLEPTIDAFRLPGQWIRKTVASFYDVEEWDWASDAGLGRALSTRFKFQNGRATHEARFPLNAPPLLVGK